MRIEYRRMNSGMSLEILLSTTEREDLSFLEKIFPAGEVSYRLLVVNQSTEGKRIPLEGLPSYIRVINVEEKGLSRSRNLALEHAEGDVLLLADDDIRYFPGFVRRILDVHSTRSDGIIIFPMKNPEGLYFGKHRMKPYKMNDVRHVYSPQISMKRNFVRMQKLRYDERFGLGSEFSDAENYVLLQSLIRRGIKPLYAGGEAIVEHATLTSSHDLKNPGNFKARMAVFKMFHGVWVYPYFLKVLFFLLRKRMIKTRDLPQYYRMFREVLDRI